jgi:hypothetical protein
VSHLFHFLGSIFRYFFTFELFGVSVTLCHSVTLVMGVTLVTYVTFVSNIITIQQSKSYYISRGRVIHISLTKRVVKVLHKPISRPFCNRYKELLIFHSKRVVKVLHKSIFLPAAKHVVKVLHKSISLPFSKSTKYQRSDTCDTCLTSLFFTLITKINFI